MLPDGKTRTCGLIGNPVGHTISPLIQNTAAADTGIDLVYVPFHVHGWQTAEKESAEKSNAVVVNGASTVDPVPAKSDRSAISDSDALSRAVQGAYALNLLGLNVTVPYKNAVIPFLSSVDPLAEKIGAVNTLVRDEAAGGYRGYNTDIIGMHQTFTSAGISLKGCKIVLIGAGGAARAAGFLCASEGAAAIHILNRHLEKAATLGTAIHEAFPETTVTWDTMENAGSTADILADRDRNLIAIQCTSVGLSPNVRVSPLPDTDAVREGLLRHIYFALDVIYNPEETAFIKAVKAAGGEAVNGLAMLVYQGTASFELWTGQHISEEENSKLLKLSKEFLRA